MHLSGPGLLLAVLLACVVAAGQGRAQTNEPPAQPEREISAETDPRSDSALQRRLNALFSEIDRLGNVRAQVRGGIVRLSGSVATPALSRDAESLAERVEGVALATNRIEIEIDTGIATRVQPLWSRLKADVQEAFLFLPILGIGLLVFALFWLIGLGAARAAAPLVRRAPNVFVQDILRTMIRGGFLVVGVLVALEVMDATAIAGSVLGAAGLVGLAVGFAVRDTIENYIASVLLTLRQPFSPRDLVMIDGHEGMVARLT